jgi:hypothetical protein
LRDPDGDYDKFIRNQGSCVREQIHSVMCKVDAAEHIAKVGDVAAVAITYLVAPLA